MLRNRGTRTKRLAQVEQLTEPLHPSRVEPQPVGTFAATGLAAMDVLPTRSGGRGLLRRRSASAAPPITPFWPTPAPSDGGPATVASQAGATDAHALAAVALSTPLVAAPPATTDERTAAMPAVTMPAAAPLPARASVVPATSAARSAEPTPGSLFAPAPAAVVEVAEIVPAQPVSSESVPSPLVDAEVAFAAPSSLFLPAPAAVDGPDGATASPSAAVTEPFAVVPALEVPAILATSASAPVAPSLTPAQSLRERSAMASEALSELSALSAYSPQPASPAPTQVRRTAAAGPSEAAGQPVPQPGDEPLGARRGSRNAADVRSMLSGARSGGERTVAATSGAPVPAQH